MICISFVYNIWWNSLQDLSFFDLEFPLPQFNIHIMNFSQKHTVTLLEIIKEINIIYLFLGIIGTKEYRKPEWVTHMEELQAALKGNELNRIHCLSHGSSFDMSVDSLDAPSLSSYSKRSGRHCASKSCEALSLKSSLPIDDFTTPFYMKNEQSTASFTSDRSSKCSVQSDPTPKQKCKTNFIQSAMTDYLNSHRHSLCSLLELMNATERKNFENRSIQEAENTKLQNEDESACNQTQYRNDDDQYEDEESKPHLFYALSPIEENSEPSTRSSSFRDSSGSDRKKIEYYIFSSSCDPIPSEPMSFPPSTPKYQTFPRSKFTTHNSSGDVLDSSFHLDATDKTIYPLEPREIDPFAYHQLHTADSQEELQEFLLLESECMNDKGRGLASAFDETTDYYNT